MLDRAVEYEKMARTEGDLWWYRALHDLVLLALRRGGVPAGAAILDAGCGTGGLMLHLRQAGFSRVSGFDLSPDAVAWCGKRSLDVRAGDLSATASLYAAGSMDAVISNDTLCYFLSDAQEDVVAQIRQILKPGGLMVVNLPALRAFGGIHDVGVGIRYRFSRADTPRLLGDRGFELVEQRYWPFLLSPAIYAARLAQRIRMRRNPQFEVRSDVEMPARLLNTAFRIATVAENRIMPWKPFGSSLFVVARKTF